MSLELIAAGTLLDMALGGIVGNTATDGVKLLWQTIKNRLVSNQPAIEGKILELEQNPIPDKLKPLQPFLHVEMINDTQFAEEISKLARGIDKASRTSKHFEAKDQGVAVETMNAPNSRIGGVDVNLEKT